MRLTKWLLLVILVSVLASGCATTSTGPKFSEIISTIPDLAAGHGRIYVYRKNSMVGAAVQPDIKLNGVAVGNSIPGGFLSLDREPGSYEIMTSTEVDRKLSLNLEAGQTLYVRLDIAMGFFVGHVFPILVETDVAKNEMQDCRYMGAK